MTVLPQAMDIVPYESYHGFYCRKLINCVFDSDFNSLYLQTFYIFSNVAATSTSNKELNSTVDECNEVVMCTVSKQSKKMKKLKSIPFF